MTGPAGGASDAERRAPRGRLLAVDYGERRVGLALSDPLGMIATPAGAIVRRPGKRPPVAEIVRRAEAADARGFVVGLPLDGAGDDTPRATEVRRIAVELVRRTGLPAYLVDERYTTAAALRTIREMGGSTRGRKEDVDAMAAAVLLRHALALGEAAFVGARVAIPPDAETSGSGIPEAEVTDAPESAATATSLDAGRTIVNDANAAVEGVAAENAAGGAAGRAAAAGVHATETLRPGVDHREPQP